MYKNGRGSYGDVVQNIPLWLEQFPNASTKVTVSSPDIPYIKESVLHLFGLGIREININCIFEDVWKEGDDRCTQSKQECIDCEVASGCAWCQGENYDVADSLTIYQRSTAICKMHKARVRANNYYWNKLYRKLE